MKYGIKVLEQEAYSLVLSAFRAQGPLSDYKRVLLEHLRCALFISLETHKAEVRRVANQEILSQIANKLNPLTNTVFEWIEEGKTGVDVIKTEKLKLKPPRKSTVGEIASVSLADRLASMAAEHNRTVPMGERAFFDLLQLPKKIYVPEAIRQLLNATEEEPPPTPKPKPPSKRHAQTSPIKALQRQIPAKVRKMQARRSKSSTSVDTQLRIETPSTTATDYSESKLDDLAQASVGSSSTVSGSSGASERSETPASAVSIPTAVMPPGGGIGQQPRTGIPSHPNREGTHYYVTLVLWFATPPHPLFPPVRHENYPKAFFFGGGGVRIVS